MNPRKYKQKENQKKKDEKAKLLEPISIFQKLEENISEEG